MDTLVKRTERGWVGHFCCGDRCLFRRNTLLEIDSTKIIVSTVGNLIINNCREDISGKAYETKIFYAKFSEPYWEIDVEKEIFIDSACSLSECEYESDIKANEMHENAVSEIIKKMENSCL